MADHLKFVNLGKRLIQKNGRLVSFEIISGVPRDAAKPWQGTTTSPNVVGPLMAAFIPFRGFEFGSIFTDESLYKDIEEVCLVAGGQGNLEDVHTVLDEGIRYKVTDCRRLRPADLTLLYAFGVKK